MALKIAGTEHFDDVELEGLFTGDNIMISVTHEVTQPGGDKSWVKYAASSTQQAYETTQQAFDRVEKNVNDGAMRVARSSYEAVVKQVSESRSVSKR